MKDEIVKDIKKIIINVFLATTLIIISDIFFYALVARVFSIAVNTIELSILLSFVFFSLFTAITKKTDRATIIILVLILLLNLINAVKISYTSEPIYLSDIKFVGNINNLIGLVNFYRIKRLIPATLGAIAIFSLLGIIAHRNSFEIKNVKMRIGIILVDLIIILALMIPTNKMKDFYLRVFFKTDEYLDFDSYVTPIEYYYKNGFNCGVYGTFLNNRFQEPKDYNEEELDKMLTKAQTDNEENIGQPNIVIVFSEAFWDITQLDEVEFSEDPIRNFHELQKQGKLVNLVSPTYGGMSENVAFELLTGGSMNYFPKGYIPIMSYYTRKSSINSPSIVKVLKNNGYNAEIVFGRDYYYSEKAYKTMGFDKYTDYYKEYNKREITDDEAVQIIINRMKNKDEKKTLYVLETIEAHMPFNEDKYDSYEVSIKKGKDKYGDITIRSYTESIHNADKSLKKIYDFVQDYEEPTIIIFLGDHLPLLYSEENKNVINYLEFFNTDNENTNYYREFNTQALILSNYDISSLKINDYSGVDLLLTSIINQMDLKIDDYYEWLYSTRDILTASNRYISLDKDGNIYSTNELKGEMENMYNIKNNMQYKMFYK